MSDIDLTTLEAVKAWAEVTTAQDDGLIQSAITGFSQHVLTVTGRSSFKSVDSFEEIYDGNGSQRMRLDNYPIVTLTSVKVLGTALTLSTGYNVAGIAVDRSRKFIEFVNGLTGYFDKGPGTVQVIYTAGYASLPPDLEIAVREAVATNYKRRAWADLKSKATTIQGLSGTISYRDWKFTPQIEAIITSYVRMELG